METVKCSKPYGGFTLDSFQILKIFVFGFSGYKKLVMPDLIRRNGK